jgi:predicted AlkP superfamily phosphohydrolase/phosphomutase
MRRKVIVIGLDGLHQPGNPYENVIPEYYQWLDEQIGSVLELLDSKTLVLVVSDHGAQRYGEKAAKGKLRE